MTELPKTFEPRAIEDRWYAHWEGARAVPPGARATRRRGRSSCRRPTSPARCTSATRSTSRCRTSSPAASGCCGKDALWVVGTDHAGIATQMVVERNLEQPGHQARRDRPRGLPRACLGVEGAVGRRDHPPAPPPRRLLRLGARALHHGRGLPARGHPRLRRAAQARPDLPRQAPGQLGPQVPDRDQRPRGRDPRRPGQVLDAELSARRRQRRDPGRDDAARDDARRHGGRGPSRTTSATRR